MEAAGIGGGTLLTPWTSDQANELFRENEEILCFNEASPDPLLIKSLLADPLRLTSMSVRARERVYKKHLLCQRISFILNHLSAGGSTYELGDERSSTVH
jgi:hypothetical protein